MVGCKYYNDGYPITNASQKSVVHRHLRGESHQTLPPHLVDMSVCHAVGLFYCIAGDCPCSESERFFTSKEALRRHEKAHHPAPNAISSLASVSNQQSTSSTASQSTSPSASGPVPTSHPTPARPNTIIHPNTKICNQFLIDPLSSQPSTWEQGLRFISYKYEHDPPPFRSNWYHYLKKGTRAPFNKLMLDIINAILQSSSDPSAHTHSSWERSSAPFWWMLVHLEMLILAPIKLDGLSIQQTIKRRIHLLRQGKVEELFRHAMQASSWTSTNDRPPRDENRAAQEAADHDSWRQAVSRATNPNTIAAIGPDNIDTVNNLYTEPHPSLDLPPLQTHHSITNSRGTSANLSVDLSNAKARAPTPIPSMPSSTLPRQETLQSTHPSNASST